MMYSKKEKTETMAIPPVLRQENFPLLPQAKKYHYSGYDVTKDIRHLNELNQTAKQRKAYIKIGKGGCFPFTFLLCALPCCLTPYLSPEESARSWAAQEDENGVPYHSCTGYEGRSWHANLPPDTTEELCCRIFDLYAPCYLCSNQQESNENYLLRSEREAVHKIRERIQLSQESFHPAMVEQMSKSPLIMNREQTQRVQEISRVLSDEIQMPSVLTNLILGYECTPDQLLNREDSRLQTSRAIPRPLNTFVPTLGAGIR